MAEGKQYHDFQDNKKYIAQATYLMHMIKKR